MTEMSEDREMNREYASALKNSLDMETLHMPYSQEMDFYELVKEGNVEALRELAPRLIVDGQGLLSKNKLRNMRYHFIIGTAFITRFCIEGGMDKEEAYTLSDVYIRRMDELDDGADLEALHNKMVFTFAERMRKIRKGKAYSLYVRKAIDYLFNNLNKNVRVRDLAEHLGLSEKYTATLFKKETGHTVLEYLEEKRMEQACNLLAYSDYSYADIADTLSYCSQSYFTKVFKKNFGITPMEYRHKNSGKKFLSDAPGIERAEPAEN